LRARKASVQTNGLVEDQERDASLLRRSMDEMEAFLFQELFTNRFLINMLIRLEIFIFKLGTTFVICWVAASSNSNRTDVNKPIELK